MLGSASSARSSRPTPERAKRSAAGPARSPERPAAQADELVALERVDQRGGLGRRRADRLRQLAERARLALEDQRERVGRTLGRGIRDHGIRRRRARRLGAVAHGDSDTTTVCSSVKVCITCAPPTRPMPLPVPARPPNGRCASQ